jgi:hypothetical protein
MVTIIKEELSKFRCFIVKKEKRSNSVEHFTLNLESGIESRNRYLLAPKGSKSQCIIVCPYAGAAAPLRPVRLWPDHFFAKT